MMETKSMLTWIGRFLGVSFVTYGLVKLAGGQFYHGDFVLNSRTTDGTFLVWAFYGYSPLYGRLIGLAELVPGILLLASRTRTLGAIFLLPVTLNITLMDFCFGFPSVKYLSLIFTMLCVALLVGDYPKLKQVFWQLSTEQRRMPKRPAVGGKWYWMVRFPLLLAALFLANLIAVSLGSTPTSAAIARCEQAGWSRAKLNPVLWKIDRDWLGFNRRGYVEIEAGGTRLRSQVRLYTGFSGWQAEDCAELASSRVQK